MKNLLVLLAILFSSSMMSTASANPHPQGWPFNKPNTGMLTKSGGFNYKKLEKRNKRAKRWRRNHPCHMFN
jgi:hypothetical protein